MKQRRVIFYGIILMVVFVLAGCSSLKTLPECPYETEFAEVGEAGTSWNCALYIPKGWQCGSPASGEINLGTEGLPDELVLRIREDTGDRFTASQAVCRKDYEAFEAIYQGWDYENFSYQTYYATNGNIVEVRYEGSGTSFVEYFRADLPYSVCVNLSAQWKTPEGVGLDEIAVQTLNSIQILW